MDVLKFLIIVVLIAAKSEIILSQLEADSIPTTTEAPTTEAPTTEAPTTEPPTAAPTAAPTVAPTAAPTTVTPPTTIPPPACVVPQPKCYRNKNGFCRTFNSACDAYNGNCFMMNPGMNWNITTTTNCEKRTPNQVKCCYDDCPYFKDAICSGEPVCGTSLSMQKCRLFASLCALKKVSCKDNNLKDWRINNVSACRGLRPNAPAVDCIVLR